ncbi:hypothetical protein [Fontibacter flavus]|uniref:Uncharacterized protein n=1 Tax=Fontibacter flavus TaxID=654838 RepID=A0ABV6FVH6_9BACT
MKPWIKKAILAIFFLPILIFTLTAAILAFKQEAITQKADRHNPHLPLHIANHSKRTGVSPDFQNAGH